MNEQTLVLFAFIGTGVIYGLVEAVKRTNKISLSLLPLIGAFLGVVVGVILALRVHEDVAIGAMLGIVIGLAATGVHEGQKNARALVNMKEEE